MTDLIDAHRSPLAGWVIAQCHGLTLIGKPVYAGPRMHALTPVFELKPMLAQVERGKTVPIHGCFPLWLLGIEQVELPAGVLTVPVDSLARTEQATLARFVEEANGMLRSMRVAASGIALANEMPKVRG